MDLATKQRPLKEIEFQGQAWFSSRMLLASTSKVRLQTAPTRYASIHTNALDTISVNLSEIFDL